MCAIMGFSKKTLPKEAIGAYFDRTLSRGPDMSRIIETPSGYLCFHHGPDGGGHAALPAG